VIFNTRGYPSETLKPTISFAGLERVKHPVDPYGSLPEFEPKNSSRDGVLDDSFGNTLTLARTHKNG
jgi:hypothetical protein